MKDTKMNNLWADFHLKQINKICDKIGNPPKKIITDWYIKKLLL